MLIANWGGSTNVQQRSFLTVHTRDAQGLHV